MYVNDYSNVPIFMWTDGVPVEEEATKQLQNVASLPFVQPHVAVMPDVHWGKGATIGSVIPCYGAVVPATVGCDIGCGMLAVETSLTADQLPDNLAALRSAIEQAVPHGRSHNGDPSRDVGAYNNPPEYIIDSWNLEFYPKGSLKQRFELITEKYPKLLKGSTVQHLGTLGTGNHFIELCLDEVDHVWIMLHTGSRGVGNRIGNYFIEQAKKEAEKWFIKLPDKDLAYLPENSELFDDYVTAVEWAQDYAIKNRTLIFGSIWSVLIDQLPPFTLGEKVINCHHNYVSKEYHYGKYLWITRKGAVSAKEGELGIIPGSMGAKSFIVRGKGNPESFCSCSHGAGRAMSRGEAKRRFTVADHAAATAHVECRKDLAVVDETPMAYKDVESVMRAQADLVEIVHTLKQVVCVKG